MGMKEINKDKKKNDKAKRTEKIANIFLIVMATITIILFVIVR